MHEVSLGGVIRDYLTGQDRERTTYEDLRQALARFLVEERGYPFERLVPRYAVSYSVRDGVFAREADIALLGENDIPRLLLVFCPGQIRSYAREVTALCRLTLPVPCPLAVVTDMREAELFASADGAVLAAGLRSLPGPADLARLAAEHPAVCLTPEQRDRESRILHAYTGLLKTCCGESCSV